jgi:hypothetical protein
MIVAKHIENKTGKKSFVSRVGAETDHIVHVVYRKMHYFFSHIDKHTTVNVLQWIAFHTLSFFRNIYLLLKEKAHRHPHSKKVIEMVTGKGEVKTNGGASFFLKKIAEDTKK